MREIVEYEILRVQIGNMPEAVRRAIADGMQPYGPLIMQADADVCFQVIVKYAEMVPTVNIEVRPDHLASVRMRE